jgi:hypothetical protein
MSQIDLYLLQTYGPWILIAIFVAKDIWAYLRNTVIPFFFKRIARKDEMELTLEERQVQAVEKIAVAIQQLSVLYATISAHTQFTSGSVQRIEGVVTEIKARIEERDQSQVTIRRPARKTN